MKIYNLIIEDKHIDTTVYPFIDKDKAISEAKRIAKKYARQESDYKEHDFGGSEGWVFYAEYSCDSDCVRVVESEIVSEVS